MLTVISTNQLRFLFQYFQHPPWDTGITPPELEKFVANHPPGRALDLGCGTGTNAIFLAKHGWQATGVDFIGLAIRAARRKAHQAGVEANFLIDDVSRLNNLSGAFDLVLDIGCLHSLPVQKRADYCRNLSRLIVPGGIYLLYAFIQEASGSSIGLEDDDINRLKAILELVDYQKGTDRGRASAWFTWRRITLSGTLAPRPVAELTGGSR